MSQDLAAYQANICLLFNETLDLIPLFDHVFLSRHTPYFLTQLTLPPSSRMGFGARQTAFQKRRDLNLGH